VVIEKAFDAIVMGGGPAGASAASILGGAGHAVLVVERDEYPRFHIGESLIPGVIPYLEEIGAARAVREAGFIRKYGAVFLTPDSSFRQRYVFGDSLTPKADLAYQVERAEFDQLLLQNARACGAEVRVAERVTAFNEDDKGVRVTLGDRHGRSHEAHAKFLIDATGQQSLVAGRLGLRQMDRNLRNIAVFAHFAGARRETGPEGGDITIVLDPEGWWWIIPLRNEVTSLGFVAPRAAFERRPDTRWLEHRLLKTPVLRERFSRAVRLGPATAVSDYSYRSSKLAGRRWILAGDAAAFLDPVFSTGVFLGVCSGVRAGRSVQSALAGGSSAAGAFAQYESWLSKRLRTYSELVKGFYNPEFVDLFMHPTDAMQLRRAVTSALAGYADQPQVRWRLRSFLNAVRANKHFEISPRLPGRREAAKRLLELGRREG
jgi:flavin-dependent dehydrogenase